jgi:3'-5' exoribonuclease
MTIRGDGVEEQRLSKTGEIRRMSKDERFKVLGVVSRASVRKDKNGKNYWDIALMDEEGVIEGKIWGNSRWWDKSGESQTEVGDPAESPIFSELVGKTLGLAGQVTEFKGQPQYNFSGVYYMNQEKFPHTSLSSVLPSARIPWRRNSSIFWRVAADRWRHFSAMYSSRENSGTGSKTGRQRWPIITPT